MMKSIVKKCLNEIIQLEKTAAKGSITNVSDDKIEADVTVDTSDEKNLSHEDVDIFNVFNQQYNMQSLDVKVEVEDDSITEDGKDTVFGQGTNPKPEDETYLGLLKKSIPKPKVTINTKK